MLCSAIKFRMRERRHETEHKIFPPKLKSSRQASSTKQHAVLCRRAGTPSTPISLRTPAGVCSELGSQQRGVQGYRQECWSTQNTRSVISPPEGECQRTGKLGAGIDTKQRPRRQLEAVQELLSVECSSSFLFRNSALTGNRHGPVDLLRAGPGQERGTAMTG